MPADSSDILNAIITKLGADSQLLAICPNGVYEDIAPPGSTRFVIVSSLLPTDADEFQRRAIEDTLFLVQARTYATSTVPAADVKAAAARIDAILDPQPPAAPLALDIPGFDVM